jgi:hypothetical protein
MDVGKKSSRSSSRVYCLRSSVQLAGVVGINVIIGVAYPRLVWCEFIVCCSNSIVLFVVRYSLARVLYSVWS